MRNPRIQRMADRRLSESGLQSLVCKKHACMVSRKPRLECVDDGRHPPTKTPVVYCPGHGGVKGNEQADRLAGKATLTMACFSEDLKC